MDLFLSAVVAIFVGGIIALFTGKWRGVSNFFGAFSCFLGTIFALKPIYDVLIANKTLEAITIALPICSASVSLDKISAFFALPIVILGFISAYFAAVTVNPRNEQHPGAYWFFYNLLIAGMLSLVASSNAVLFIMSWEIMSVAAYFLIAHRVEMNTARNAAWQFLVASHIGTTGIFFLFAILASAAGGFQFETFHSSALAEGSAAVIFFLALFGFGVKVGFFPLHIWMPDSYTFAESHVSAVLSGAMSKMGFYGLIRVLTFLPVHAELWGWVLLFGGLITGIYALVIALVKLDLKKVISYSSMENAGIILMAIGTGILANRWNQPLIAFTAFSGALLHIFNHALCKGLLFLCAGSVYFATGTRRQEQMGGIGKSMPVTATAFGIASIAISGLPPFNNFISEFLIFMSGLKAASLSTPKSLLLSAAVLLGLGLIGGLAAALFTRSFGLVFLGTPRTNRRLNTKNIKSDVNFTLIILSAAIIAASIFAPMLISPFAGVVSEIVKPLGITYDPAYIATISAPVKTISLFSLAVILITCIAVFIKSKFLDKNQRSDAPTWDCGFLKGTPRIQYTSSSFSEPANEVFVSVNRLHIRGEKIKELFPAKSSFHTEATDSAEKHLFIPAFNIINKFLIMFRGFQHGKLHLYIFYIAVTLLALLIWKVVY
ncbi:MAG: Hydrogenase-4 component B [bacterium ADurb.Bin157]|nr:MAG: Hydrogenase-4 component B [bacterium ADurb.Bin157]